MEKAITQIHVKWFHFIEWTNKGLEIEIILYDEEFWENVMLPILNTFFALQCYRNFSKIEINGV